MASSRESVVTDPSGDVFLLLAKDSDDNAPTQDAPTDDADKTPAKPPTREVEIQVSSRHLALASKVFGHMFSGKSWEHDPPADRDFVTVPLLEDNYDAMIILLNIIHGRTRSVKRRIPLQKLLQLTILINKYEFHEVAELYTDMWLEGVWHGFPTHANANLASWIYICWALGRSAGYTALTKIAIRETDCGVVDPDGLVPLPYWINDEIRSRRQDLLTKFLDLLSKLLKIYRGPSRRCRKEPDCDAAALGKSERALTKAELYPIPEPSSLNMSIDDLFSQVRNMDLVPLCEKQAEKMGKYNRSGYSADHPTEWDDQDDVFLKKNGARQHIGKDLEDAMSVITSDLRGLTMK